ncbi:MAG: glycosyltransferase [Campylobacterales bacterium]|nr:glycosyltransferase [Campylobacterales bacterium]
MVEEISISIVCGIFNEQDNFKKIKKNLELCEMDSSIEFIFVNDGSTDNTKKLMTSVLSDRVILINKKNSGLASALNLGVQHSRGRYIARIDADDLILPKRLQIQLNFLEEYGLDFCGSFCFIRGSDGQDKLHKVPTGYENIKKYISIENPFVHSTIFAKRSVFLENPYDESYKFMQDYELWTRLVKKYRCDNLPIPTVVRYEDNNFDSRETYKNLKKWQYYKRKSKIQFKAFIQYPVFTYKVSFIKNFFLYIFRRYVS